MRRTFKVADVLRSVSSKPCTLVSCRPGSLCTYICGKQLHTFNLSTMRGTTLLDRRNGPSLALCRPQPFVAHHAHASERRCRGRTPSHCFYVVTGVATVPFGDAAASTSTTAQPQMHGSSAATGLLTAGPSQRAATPHSWLQHFTLKLCALAAAALAGAAGPFAVGPFAAAPAGTVLLISTLLLLFPDPALTC